MVAAIILLNGPRAIRTVLRCLLDLCQRCSLFPLLALHCLPSRCAFIGCFLHGCSLFPRLSCPSFLFNSSSCLVFLLLLDSAGSFCFYLSSRNICRLLRPFNPLLLFMSPLLSLLFLSLLESSGSFCFLLRLDYPSFLNNSPSRLVFLLLLDSAGSFCFYLSSRNICHLLRPFNPFLIFMPTSLSLLLFLLLPETSGSFCVTLSSRNICLLPHPFFTPLLLFMPPLLSPLLFLSIAIDQFLSQHPILLMLQLPSRLHVLLLAVPRTLKPVRVAPHFVVLVTGKSVMPLDRVLEARPESTRSTTDNGL